jgi:hypothetical protein
MADRLNTALSSEELVVNESNARKKHETDPALVASIASAGLMYPITVKRWRALRGHRRRP